MSFRGQNKETLTIKIPVTLGTTMRENAGRDRRSMSEIVTEALCEKYGIDPRVYGITYQPETIPA